MNARNIAKYAINGPAGNIEIAVADPGESSKGIALIAHPHPLFGGTMDNKVVQTLAKTFFALGYTAVRFNFRGIGESAGNFSEGIGETEDALVVAEFARSEFGDLPFVLAGFSFGSFVQTRVREHIDAQRLVLIAPAVKRFAVGNVPADTLVIHGEQDDVVALADVFDWARPQELPVIVFPGTGHFFHGRLPQLQNAISGSWQS